MLMKKRLLALTVIAFALLLASNPAIYALSGNPSVSPTLSGHEDEPSDSTFSESATPSLTYDGSANSRRARDTLRISTNGLLLPSSSRDTNVDRGDTTVDSLLDFWPNPMESLTIEDDKPSFAEIYEIKPAPYNAYLQAEDPPLVVDVTTDKELYYTDETMSIAAKIAHQNGTIMTPPGWANVDITVWDATTYYWTVMPPAAMTFNSSTNLWEYSYIVNVTDPSAQFPFHWNITVSAYDGVLDSGVGYTAVNTVVYVGSGVSHLIYDDWYPEFGSIVVDGGTLNISNAVVPMVPDWDGACNVTARNGGTIIFENMAIGSLTGYYWLFWILDNSEAYLDYTEVYNTPPMMMGPPGFLAGFNSSISITNSSYIDGSIGTMFSSSLSMEDSESTEGVMLMGSSHGHFNRVLMPDLTVYEYCEATIENSHISGDTIVVALFSHAEISNCYTDVLGVMNNSTATATNCTVDEQVIVFSGSSLTANNLTIGDDMISSVRLDVSGHSEVNIDDFRMMGWDASVYIDNLSKATFNLVDWTARYIYLSAEDGVDLTVSNAVLDATVTPASSVNLRFEDKTVCKLSDVDIQATSQAQMHVSSSVIATLEHVDVKVIQSADADARLNFNVEGSDITFANCHFNTTGPSNWKTDARIALSYGVYATITNVTLYSGYYGSFYAGYDCDVVLTSFDFTCLYQLSFDMYAGVLTTVENCHFEAQTYLYSSVQYGSWATVSNTTFYCPDEGVFVGQGGHLTMTDSSVAFSNAGVLVFVEGAHATITNCNVTIGPDWGGTFVEDGAWVDMVNVDLNVTLLEGSYSSWLLLESSTVTGSVTVYEGAWLEMYNVTIDDSLDIGSGCEATIQDCTVGFGPNNNGQVNIYEGSTATMKNVDVNLTSWNFRVSGSCDVTLENVDIVSPFGYGFYVYEASVIRIANSTIDLNMTQFGQMYVDGGSLVVEGSVIKAYSLRISNAAYSSITNTELYTGINVDAGCVVTMEGCLLNSTLASTMSHTTLIGCTVIDEVTTEMGGSLTLDTTTMTKTLYVGVAGTVTIIDSTVTIEAIAGWPPDLSQSIYWLNTHYSTVTLNGTTDALWVYNLHNHYNASMIYPLGTVNILQQRWCLGVHVVDDYGDPIPSALVEIRNSTMDLIYSGYTDNNGTVRIYPGNGVYTVTSYANGKSDTDTVAINDMCAVTSFHLDITEPVIGNITHDPTTPNYKQDVTVTAEISDPSGISSAILKYNDGTGWTDLTMTDVGGNQYSVIIPAKSYGTTVWYYIVAADNSANTAASDEFTYNVIDNLMPEASGFTLDPTSPVYHQDVTVSVTLTDPNGVVEAWLIFSVDGTEYRVKLTLVGADRYSAVVSKQPYGTEVTYSVWAKDGLGNTGTTMPLTYPVGDDIDPTGGIVSPTTGSFLSETVDISVSGYDVNFDRMELYANGDLEHIWTSSGVQTYALDTEALGDGAYTLKLVIYDKAGNSVEKTIAITVDNIDPTVSMASPEQDAELSGTVSIDFSFSDTNLDKVYLHIDNAAFDVTGSSTYSWDTTTVVDGSHIVKIVAIDKAGNQKETQATVTTTNAAEAVGDNMIVGFAAGAVIFLIIGVVAAYFLIKRTKPMTIEVVAPEKKPKRKLKS